MPPIPRRTDSPGPWVAYAGRSGYNSPSLPSLPSAVLPPHVPTLPVTPTQFAIAIVLVTIGSAIQGSIGIGLAVVAAPILLLVSPEFVPGPILVAAMLLTLLMAHRERSHTAWDEVAVGTVGRIVGMLPAAYALSRVPVTSHSYDLLFSAIVLAGVLLSVGGWHIPLTLRNVFLSAVGSGFVSTVSSIGGPPMALVYQNEEGPRIRSTLSAIFTIGTVISAAGLWWIGRFGVQELLLGALLMPGVLIGFGLSRHLGAAIDRSHLRPAILAFSALSAVVIAARALWSD
jgi:uncharacterized protein